LFSRLFIPSFSYYFTFSVFHFPFYVTDYELLTSRISTYVPPNVTADKQRPCYQGGGPLTTKARVRFQASAYEICDGRSDTGKGSASSTSRSPCQYHSTNAMHLLAHVSPTPYNLSNLQRR